MKKLLLTSLITLTFSPCVLADEKLISIEMSDKKMSEMVQIINAICASHIEIDKLTKPNMDISINLENKKCTEVIKLIKDFDKNA